MGDLAIHVENLSKQYRIGRHRQSHETMVAAALRSMAGPLRRISKLLRGQSMGAAELDDTLWALRDVSFQVGEGEVVGIIGHNGSGKSTLLKLISRITYPTTGHIKIYGRVGSLLEVGTGFHPELTGRENIYLNGTVLGMNRSEIDRKFDEIVEFSGVERFLDTPVKHYSSGMAVRLAFAVAAHLEPEILLIDEVLAVGDAAFQKKSLGKMEDVASQGRTVLFVSHNLPSVQALCSRALLLQNGCVMVDGAPDEAISQYMKSLFLLAETTPLKERVDRIGGEDFLIESVEFLDAETLLPTRTLLTGQHTLIKVTYNCLRESGIQGVAIHIAFRSSQGNFLFMCGSDAVGKVFDTPPGPGSVVCTLDKWPLGRGRYTYSIHTYWHGRALDSVHEAGFVDTEAGDFYGTGVLPASSQMGVYVDYTFTEWLPEPTQTHLSSG
jgi:lipopolysaccharide transport system ATP-binding protein